MAWSSRAFTASVGPQGFSLLASFTMLVSPISRWTSWMGLPGT